MRKKEKEKRKEKNAAYGKNKAERNAITYEDKRHYHAILMQKREKSVVLSS